jgi:hypothetical protein
MSNYRLVRMTDAMMNEVLEIIGEPGWDRTIDLLIKSKFHRGVTTRQASPHDAADPLFSLASGGSP